MVASSVCSMRRTKSAMRLSKAAYLFHQIAVSMRTRQGDSLDTFFFSRLTSMQRFQEGPGYETRLTCHASHLLPT